MIESAVYKITNTATNRVYVGGSCYVEKRFKSHKCSLGTGKHSNKQLQADWNKYGETAFEFEVIEYVATDVLRDMEQHWVDHYQKSSAMYNDVERSSKMGNMTRAGAASPEQVVSARGNRTQEAVAKLLEVSVNTIQNWEHGRAPVPHLAYKELLATRDEPCQTF